MGFCILVSKKRFFLYFLFSMTCFVIRQGKSEWWLQYTLSGQRFSALAARQNHLGVSKVPLPRPYLMSMISEFVRAPRVSSRLNIAKTENAYLEENPVGFRAQGLLLGLFQCLKLELIKEDYFFSLSDLVISVIVLM